MKNILIDADPGHDDAIAIMFAAASTELNILGITCVAGNSTLDNTVINALKVCTFINRKDIKIYSGSDKPLINDLVTASHVHGKSGLEYNGEEILIPDNYKKQKMSAVDFIIETCSNNDEITLCPTGPLTNIAKALIKKPEISKNIEKIVFMGGAAMTLGNITPSAEFNIFVDPHAANVVLNSNIKIIMMGLDVTHKVLVDESIVNDFTLIGNKSSILFKDLMEFYSRFHKKKYNTLSSPLHDPCVIGYLIKPELFSGKLCNVIVEEESKITMGKTVVDWLDVTERNKNCLVINEVNSEGFFKLLREKLSLLP